MSRIAQVLFAVLAIFAVGISATGLFYKGGQKHPDLADHCYYSDYKLSLAFNEVIKPTNINACIEVKCREDYTLEIKYCPKLSHGSPCLSLPNDFTKPFPDCCPEANCHH